MKGNIKENMKIKLGKKKVIILLVILAVVIGGVILSICLIKNKGKEEEPVAEEQAINDIFDYSDSKVDMNNTENAEVKDGLKIATSEKLKEEKIYNDMRILNAEITSTKNRASFIANVKNDYEKEIQGEIIYVIFLKADGSEMTRIETAFPDLEPKGEGQILLSTNEDIANAYDYRIERK